MPGETEIITTEPLPVNELVVEEMIEQTATTELSGTTPVLPGETEIIISTAPSVNERAIEEVIEQTATTELSGTTPVLSGETEIIISTAPSVNERVVEEMKEQTATTEPSGTTPVLPGETEVVTSRPLPVNEAAVKQMTVKAEMSSEPTIAPVDNGNNNITLTVQKQITAVKQSRLQPSLPFTQYKSEILSDKIKRFVISRAVQSNEPVGTINDINFDANNIATVYAYSEVRELKDKNLYYVWSLDGKDIAKVKVDVGSNLWRSYSSKFIQPSMHGEWKIELQNEKGENLAVNQFNY